MNSGHLDIDLFFSNPYCSPPSPIPFLPQGAFAQVIPKRPVRAVMTITSAALWRCAQLRRKRGEGGGINDTCAAASDCEILAASTATCLRNGLMRYGTKATKAVSDKLQGILDRQVWDPRHNYLLPRYQLRRPLHEKWVIGEKKTPEGAFEKDKARMVVLGNLQTEDQLTTSTRSPTPSLHTIFVQTAIAAVKGRHVFTFDAVQAFLHSLINIVLISRYVTHFSISHSFLD